MPEPGTARVRALASAMEADLRGNILPFWATRVPDPVHGGFVGLVDDRGRVDADAPRGSVLNARILWTFSAASRRYPDDVYREVARRARDEVLGRFWDGVHGGVYWLVDAGGAPLVDRKQTYALAFALYALAESARVATDEESLERAIALFEAIEAHAKAPEAGGYEEARGRDWRPLADVRLSPKDENAPRSMNTHLHVMEAYAGLLRVWPEPRLLARLQDLVTLHLDRIVDADTGHLRLFFDDAWHPLGDAVSYGHDIEASWLVVEAAEIAGDPDLLSRARETSLRLARAALAEGLDREHGGLHAERSSRGVLDDDKHWWMQAEAVVGFLKAWELSGDDELLTGAESVWRFVERFVVDREHGEWRWRVGRDGAPVPGLPTVEPWKCPYHNSRAALEVLDLRDRLLGGPSPSTS